MHASDLAWYVAAKPMSVLAQLSKAGTTYSNISLVGPADSIPGVLAMTTGAIFR